MLTLNAELPESVTKFGDVPLNVSEADPMFSIVNVLLTLPAQILTVPKSVLFDVDVAVAPLAMLFPLLLRFISGKTMLAGQLLPVVTPPGAVQFELVFPFERLNESKVPLTPPDTELLSVVIAVFVPLITP